MDDNPSPLAEGIVVYAGPDPRIRCFSAQEPRTEQTKNFGKYLPNALPNQIKGVILPCHQINRV
jgi:hypothetical protein